MDEELGGTQPDLGEQAADSHRSTYFSWAADIHTPRKPQSALSQRSAQVIEDSSVELQEGKVGGASGNEEMGGRGRRKTKHTTPIESVLVLGVGSKSYVKVVSEVIGNEMLNFESEDCSRFLVASLQLDFPGNIGLNLVTDNFTTFVE